MSSVSAPLENLAHVSSPLSNSKLNPAVDSLLGADPDDNVGDDITDKDTIFDELEKEDDFSYRAHRIEQLHAEFASAKETLRSADGATCMNTTEKNIEGHSNNDNNYISTIYYPTLPNDLSLLDSTTRWPRCVIHFLHPDFSRCSMMDRNLEMLAPQHSSEVRFARIDVRDCPFVVEKLKIRVLPCVIGFVDGQVVERILGFEGLGLSGQDAINEFRTEELEERLLSKGILLRRRLGKFDYYGNGQDCEDESEDDTHRHRPVERKRIRYGNTRRGQDEDSDDWD